MKKKVSEWLHCKEEHPADKWVGLVFLFFITVFLSVLLNVVWRMIL